LRSNQPCTNSKTPYRDDTTHFVFEPIQFLARLAALVLRDREFAHARAARRQSLWNTSTEPEVQQVREQQIN